MNEERLAHVDATFEELNQNAAIAYRKVYDSILQQLKDSTERGLNGMIAQLEAKELNKEVIKLTRTVKEAAISEMLASGCKEYSTETGWTEIQQVTGVIKTDLCKVQVDIVRPTAKAKPATGSKRAATRKEKELEELARQYGVAEKILKDFAAAGAVVVGISLIIPGWDFPVKALCAAGAIIAVGGSGGALHCNSKKNEAMSKFESIGKTDTQKQAADSIDSLAKQITDSQYEHNFKLYCEWLEQVKQALIAECDKLSDL